MQEVLQIFTWICALGAAVAVPMSLRKSRLACIGWLVFYCLAYWHLSTNGRYAEDLRGANDRWIPMHCEKTVRQGRREVPVLNALGAFFSPLVAVDRLSIHREKESVSARLSAS